MSKKPSPLVLSIFPGIDMLGRAFTEQGCCVVRGPDINIDGGDIRDFNPPAKRFDGVIGGSPCQDFSPLNRNPSENSVNMLREYIRVVAEGEPDWFLFENVLQVPEFEIDGYESQRFVLDLAWFSEWSRKRTFVFGSRSGQLINPIIGVTGQVKGTAVIGSDERSFKACCEIQGLPASFDLPFFSLQGKKQAVANGVPLQLGRYVASLIMQEFYGQNSILAQQELRRCLCGCKRAVVGRAKYSGDACRKRAQRQREKRAG